MTPLLFLLLTAFKVETPQLSQSESTVPMPVSMVNQKPALCSLRESCTQTESPSPGAVCSPFPERLKPCAAKVFPTRAVRAQLDENRLTIK